MLINEERSLTVDGVRVMVASNRNEMGKRSAANVSKLIKKILQKKDEVRMIFAAAPSQDEFLDELVKDKSIDWSKIVAFHMDEYIGLNKDSEQLFSKYLMRNLFSKVNFKKVHIINSYSGEIYNECERYETLLKEKQIDIVCMGIGENGHIAFNDPPVADFKDKKFVKVVKLDEKCRQQQVNDGCFLRLSYVPSAAITLTIPALLSAAHLNIVVPGVRKAEAVRNTLYGVISTSCPASIIRKHKDAAMYIDIDSAGKFLELQVGI